ncbi:MAG TPA: hypothetical protein VL285_20970 [Bryobacteraceae bacterium]|nr:hypothetical protein [Bryobacteraceae bacterium]
MQRDNPARSFHRETGGPRRSSALGLRYAAIRSLEQRFRYLQQNRGNRNRAHARNRTPGAIAWRRIRRGVREGRKRLRRL